MRLSATDLHPARALRWPVRRPVLTLALALLLTAAAALGASRIRPSASLRAMVGDSSASAVALDRVLDHFREVDDLLVLATLPGDDAGDPATGAAPLLTFARDLEGAIRADPGTSSLCARVSLDPGAQVSDFVQHEVVPAGLWYLDDIELEEILRRLTLPQMRDQLRRDEAMIATPGPAAAALSKTLLKDPLRLREFLTGRGRGLPGAPTFLSPDGRALLVRVTGTQPASDLDFCARITAGVGAVADRVRAPGVRVQIAGAYAIADRAASSIRRDMISNSIWSVVMMQVLFLLSYRRLGAFAITFLPVGVAILLAFGSFSVFKTRITPLTAVAGAVLAGLGIDYCIHVLSHYQAALGPSRSDPVGATDRTIREIGLPLLAAGLTTVHGFVAVAFAGIAALRDFALLAALGLAWSMLAAVTLLPALLGLAGGRGRSIGVNRFTTGPLVRSVVGRARLWMLLAGSGLVLCYVAAIAPSGRPLALDADLTVMHPRPSPPLEAQREISRRFPGMGDSLLLLISGDSPDELARRAHAAQGALSGPEGRAAGITGMVGLASLVPDPARAGERLRRLEAVDPGRVVADFESAVRETAFNPEAFRPYADFLRTLASRREPPTVLSLTRYPSLADAVLSLPERPGPRAPAYALSVLSFNGSLNDRAHRDHAIAGVRSLLAGVPGVTVTGIGVVGSDLEQLVHSALPRVLALSGAAVALTVLVAFRRLGDLLLVLIPLAWGFGAVLAWAALARERLNMANMIALPLLVGIGVDYGIFMTGLARTCRREGLGADSLLDRMATSGHAVLMTSATTVIGFGTLVTSSTPAIQSLGRLVAIGVSGCVVGTLFLLVPLLYVIHRAR